MSADPTTKLLYATTDAMVWAEEFCRIVRENGIDCTDEGFMVGWFANAIEIGRDASRGVDLGALGQRLAQEVDRLWPGEDDPAYRAGCLAEEAGEVLRAVTKRRHAGRAHDGRCKGMTADEWTEELALELAQVLGVVLDIAQREGIDLEARLRDCVATLEAREAGS